MDVETESIISCAKCPFQTRKSSEMTNHHLRTHALEVASKIFESQVTKLMSPETLINTYGFEAGSLKDIFTDKSDERSSHVVQVLALNPDFIHISDSSCIVTNCIAACDVGEILGAAQNCVIKMTKWSVIQIVPKQEPGQRKKSEYGIKMEAFEMIESRRTLPMLGSPKVIQVTIILDEKTDLDRIVIDLLDNIISEEGEVEEKKKEWCGKMLRILKKNQNIKMWQCTVCRSKLSDKMDEKVVSHAQLHLRFFPGYRCPGPHKCRSETLLKYNKHLEETGHDKTLQETPEMEAEEVAEVAEEEVTTASNPNTEVTSVLEELTNIFHLEPESEEMMETPEIISEEVAETPNIIMEEEDQEEEDPDSVADVLADFYAVPTAGDVDGNNDQPSFNYTSSEQRQDECDANCEEDKKETTVKNANNQEMVSEAEEGQIISQNNEDSRFNKADRTSDVKSDSNQEKVIDVTEVEPGVFMPKCEEELMTDKICSSSLSKTLPAEKVYASSESACKSKSSNAKEIETQSDACNRIESENVSIVPKFDWVRDVSSKIKMTGDYYECEDCGVKSLKTQGWGGQREILNHLSDSHLQRFQEFTCMICRLKSQSLRTFLNHLKIKHKKKPSRDFNRAVTEINQNLGAKRKIIEVDLDVDENVQVSREVAQNPSKESQKHEEKVNLNNRKLLEDELTNRDASPKKKKMRKEPQTPQTQESKKREEKVMQNHLKVLADLLTKTDTSPKAKKMRKNPQTPRPKTPPKTSPQIFNWHREMTKSVAITKNKIQCLKCKFYSSSSNSVVSHLESFHFKDLKDLKCPHCDAVCSSLINYNNHVRMKHRVKLTLSLNKKNLTDIDESSSMAIINESIVHKADKRPGVFLWQNEVMKRIKVSGQMYHCSECDFQSKSQSQGGGGEILNHIELQHMAIRGYKCGECSTVLHNFISFFQHLNKSHKISLKLLQIL